jgi:hypothetical protein
VPASTPPGMVTTLLRVRGSMPSAAGGKGATVFRRR